MEGVDAITSAPVTVVGGGGGDSGAAGPTAATAVTAVAPSPGGGGDEAAMAAAAQQEQRKRVVLTLILRHLHDNGFSQAYQSLCAESGMSLGQVDAAENVDLTTVVQAYEEFHESKFGRKPRLSRAMPGDIQATPLHNSSPAFHPSGVGPFMSPPFNPVYQHGNVIGAQVQCESYTGVGSTCRLGSTLPVSQEELIQTLSQLPEFDPSHVFTFERPRRNAGTKRSVHLFLSEQQEKILYALVGCAGIGWNIRAITPDSRDFLSNRCGINKEMLQLFFKNRSKRPKRDRSRRKEPSQPQAINGFAPLVQKAASQMSGQPAASFGGQQQPGPSHNRIHQLPGPPRMAPQHAPSPTHQMPSQLGGGTPTMPSDAVSLPVESHSGHAQIHTPINVAEPPSEMPPLQPPLAPPLLNMPPLPLASQLMMQHLVQPPHHLEHLVTQGTPVDGVQGLGVGAGAAAPGGALPMVNATGERV